MFKYKALIANCTCRENGWPGFRLKTEKSSQLERPNCLKDPFHKISSELNIQRARKWLVFQRRFPTGTHKTDEHTSLNWKI